MKRFTETSKWSDPWFQDLTPEFKLFWLYLCDNCDQAGVWTKNMRLADFQLGLPIAFDKAIEAFGDRVEILTDGKVWVKKFIAFQYGKLNPECKPHTPVFDCIQKHCLESKCLASIDDYSAFKAFDRLSHSQSKAIERVQEKEKEKEKEIRGESRGEITRFVKPAIETCKLQAAKIGLPEQEAEMFWNYYESNGWRVGKNPMKSWTSAMANWKKNFESKIYEQRANTSRSNKQTVDRNKGTFNEGNASKYANAYTNPLPDVKRPSSGGNEKSSGTVHNAGEGRLL